MSFIKAERDDPYYHLLVVYREAYLRASRGKGLRHVTRDKEPFHHQQICRYARVFGIGYSLGQCTKKAEEIPRITDLQAKYNEILDIINYAAAAAIIIGEEMAEKGVSYVHKEIGDTASVPLRVEEIKEVQSPSDCPAETGRRAVPRYPTEG